MQASVSCCGVAGDPARIWIFCLAVLIQYRSVTDRQMHDEGIYSTSIASHGKQEALLWQRDHVMKNAKIWVVWGLGVTQGHQQHSHSIEHIRLPICL